MNQYNIENLLEETGVSFERLFEQQEKLYQAIMSDINEGTQRINILGKAGCGKSHLTEHIIRHVCSSGNYMILRFIGDIQCIERKYYPIISGLSSYCNKYNTIKTIKKAIPKLLNRGTPNGGFLEYITNTIITRTTENTLYINQLFDENEIDLLYKIKSCITGKKIIIYLDNLHWWDKKSLDFIYLLFKHSEKYVPELKSALVICNTTVNQVSPHHDFVEKFLVELYFKNFHFEDMTLVEYEDFLVSIGLSTMNSAVVKILYKITNQHLTISKNALSCKIDKDIFSMNSKMSDEDFLKIIIEKRLSQLGANGEQISEVLKFASLIGLAFSILELEYLVSYNEADIQKIINQADDMALIEYRQPGYRFSHEIIRELFCKKLESNKYAYCQKAVLCYKTLHPYDYLLRINQLVKIGDIPELEKLYCLNVFRQLEESGIYEGNEIIEVLLSADILDYIALIQKTYKLYQKGGYDDAIEIASCIENIYPLELLAIRDQIISLCMTKSLDDCQRQKAVTQLENYETMLQKFSEEQIWSKTMMCLLTAYIHVRDIERARDILKILYSFYAERSRYCDDYKKELNVLRRKTTPFYELEPAAITLKRAVVFFAPANDGSNYIQYPIQYFMALTNYSSNQICSGEFCKAFEYTKTALDLYNSMKGLRFPRIEIAINNYLISGFLSYNITLPDTIASFIMLLEKLEKIADMAIIQTNLAALYLLDFQLEKALAILDDLQKRIEKSSCKEYSYIYHVKTNLLIISLLKNANDEAKDYLAQLDEIIPNLYQNTYFAKKQALLLEIYENATKILYKKGFERYLISQNPFANSAWNFYGLLPAFNTLEYWSET